MKIVFFGLGSIGMRHAKLIKENFDFEIFAYRSNKNSEKNNLGIKEVYNLKDILKFKPDVAFITNPTSEHMNYASFCAKNGINMFIEKPLFDKQENIQQFIEEVNKNKIKIYLAYCLRFHPIIIWLKDYLKDKKPIHVTVNSSSYLPDWRPNINYLKNYSALKNAGGGVINDLSHEIDYLYYLFGDIKDIKVNSKKISNVTVDSEDFADIILQFENKLFGNLHLNFLSRLNRREIIIDFEDFTIIADLNDNRIVIKRDEDEKIIEFDLKKNDYFLSQLKYFFDNIGKEKIMNNFDESLRVFDIIVRIKKEANL